MTQLRITAQTRAAAQPRRRVWVAAWTAASMLLGMLGALVAGPAQAAAWTLDELMAQLGKVRAGEAQFVEHRKVQQLDRTLVYSGRLSFTAPDTLVRETDHPRVEKMVAQGRYVTLTQGRRTRTVSLDAAPEALAMVEAIRGTLAGDRSSVERHFEPSLSGSSERWTLELIPRDAKLRTQVARVTLQGRQALLREVRVQMGDGDESVMKIEPITAPQ